MARARHAKPSGLLSRLLPGRTARREAARRQAVLLRQLADELQHLRAVADAQALLAQQAQEQARLAEERAALARAEGAALRAELTRLREELLWAWAEGRLPLASLTDGLAGSLVEGPGGGSTEVPVDGPAGRGTVIDLREPRSA